MTVTTSFTPTMRNWGKGLSAQCCTCVVMAGPGPPYPLNTRMSILGCNFSSWEDEGRQIYPPTCSVFITQQPWRTSLRR